MTRASLSRPDRDTRKAPATGASRSTELAEELASRPASADRDPARSRAPPSSGRQLGRFLFACQRYVLELAAAERSCLVAELIEGGVVVERLVVEEG